MKMSSRHRITSSLGVVDGYDNGEDGLESEVDEVDEVEDEATELGTEDVNLESKREKLSTKWR